MHNYIVAPMPGGTSGAYAGPCLGGTYHDQDGEDVVTASVENGEPDGFNPLPNARAEVYTFDEQWEGIVQNARDQQDAEIPAAFRFKHLFQNLYADFSNTDSYQIKALDVRMTDVGNDFERYMNWLTAMTYQPKVTVVDGERQVEVPDESAAFYDDKGQLLPEYDYIKTAFKCRRWQAWQCLTKSSLSRPLPKQQDAKLSWRSTSAQVWRHHSRQGRPVGPLPHRPVRGRCRAQPRTAN